MKMHRTNASVDATAWLHNVTISDVLVPVIQILVRVTIGTEERFYVAYINELQERVLDDLAFVPELQFMMQTPKEEEFGNARMPNIFRKLAASSMPAVSIMAATPWTPRQFAEARASVEAKRPPGPEQWDTAQLHRLN